MNATHAEYRVEFTTNVGQKVQYVEIEKGSNMTMRAIRLAAAAQGVTGQVWVKLEKVGHSYVVTGDVTL